MSLRSYCIIDDCTIVNHEVSGIRCRNHVQYDFASATPAARKRGRYATREYRTTINTKGVRGVFGDLVVAR